jgi:hypothetical protein
MIKIKHKQTGTEYNYSATVLYARKIDLTDFDIIEWENVVDLLFDRADPKRQQILEKADAIKIINDSPLSGYWFVDLPRPDLNSHAKFPPKQNEIAPNSTNAKPVTVSWWKKLWIKFIELNFKTCFKWIIANIYSFLFYVAVGIAIYYFTIYKPILHR